MNSFNEFDSCPHKVNNEKFRCFVPFRTMVDKAQDSLYRRHIEPILHWYTEDTVRVTMNCKKVVKILQSLNKAMFANQQAFHVS